MERRAYSEQLMSDAVELVATRIANGGAAVAVSAWWIDGLNFLGQHSSGILTFCGLVGAAVSASSLLMNWYFHTRSERYELRQKQRRRQPRG
jgi:hypothetical protein